MFHEVVCNCKTVCVPRGNTNGIQQEVAVADHGRICRLLNLRQQMLQEIQIIISLAVIRKEDFLEKK